MTGISSTALPRRSSKSGMATPSSIREPTRSFVGKRRRPKPSGRQAPRTARTASPLSDASHGAANRRAIGVQPSQPQRRASRRKPRCAKADERWRHAGHGSRSWNRRLRIGNRRSRSSRHRWRRPASTTTSTPPRPLIDRHQALMWEVGDLMHEWEELQMTETECLLQPGPAPGTSRHH